jgi:D-3-phosphoglycerate dehydrogenase / 2-oxoglutarate reductase
MKIVVADKVDSDLIQMLKNENFQVIDLSIDKEQLVKELENADGLIVRSATQANKELLSNAKNLKIIGRPGVGVDNIDLEYCKKHNIHVVNSPEAPSISVAEFTIGLILNIARKISFADAKLKSGNWAKNESMGLEIFGKTLGVVGCSGAIGKIVSEYAIALNMRVVGYDVIINEELKQNPKFEYVSLDKIFQESDIITVHVPLLPSTKYLINKETIKMMKESVILINAARGGIFNEDDLIEALKSNKIAGCALDVFENEPNINDELRKFKNVIITPHIGANTNEAQQKNGTIVGHKIINYLSNK